MQISIKSEIDKEFYTESKYLWKEFINALDNKDIVRLNEFHFFYLNSNLFYLKISTDYLKTSFIHMKYFF